jgi:hypothetical protein
LVAFGMTNILVYGSIFDSIRPKHKFFHCAQCMGFWVGVFLFFLFWLSGVDLFPNPIVGAFAFGCVSSGTSYVLCNLCDDNGVKVKFLRSDLINKKEVPHAEK